MIHLGTNPIAWSNDDLPELGGATPLEQCLTEAREAGFEGIELGNKFPREARALAAVLAAHGLRHVSGWYSGELLSRDVDAEIEAMTPHLELLKANGAQVLIYAEVSGCIHGQRDVPLSRRPVMPQAAWPEFTARLSALARHVREQGLRLVVHHHMGTVIETEAEIHRLMAETSADVGLLLDAGHATFAGADPVALATRYAARIHHVHCKDVRLELMAVAKAQDWSFLEAVIAGVFTVPGDGGVDFPAVLAALKAGGYDDGWMVVEAEQDPARAHPLTYARLGYANLSAMVRAAGFEIAAPLPVPVS
ncbi:myo-inosose-2 dehydratase [Acidocella aquatica]|uniref:Myo-inosose-2 dehydratase n=1 Tax=Acidocella aquatica TaxID=1922313 RepID=A0ABQ6AA65_9PROT|nr:myo-inosose-2 dehydratase [Acidocella aquatica]GLR67128.1 myo-inosose-2 dehydratase [Acidocella aquatica]